MAMTTHLKKIVALLSKGSTEEAIAAAVVLGALAPKEKAVVDALARTLGREDNLPLALAAARALGEIGNAAALKALLPLLTAEGELRNTGALAIAGCGRAALPAVKKALAGADFHHRLVLTDILARMHTAESLRLVLDAFFDPNFEMVKAVGRTLRAEVPRLTEAERKAAAAATLAFLKTRDTQKSRSAVNSALIYLGHLARVEAAPALLVHSAPDRSRATRRHSLQSLRHLAQLHPVGAATAKKIFPYLDDPDFDSVVEPSLGILDQTELPAALQKDLERLVGGRYPQVRQFAVRKLAVSSGKRALDILVGLLDGKDESLRRSAVHALRGSPSAPALVLPRLLTEKDSDRLWELVHLVKAHASGLKPAELKKLSGAAVKYLGQGDRRAEALLHLLRHADPDAYFKFFYARALAARKARRYEDAERNLRLITRSEHFDAEAKFQLGLMILLGAGKNAASTSPKVKLALEVFHGLADDAAFDLEKRIKKEARAVGPESVYLIAFGLVERSGMRRRLGAGLLTGLVKKGARTKVGRMARAKLETEGLS